MCTRTHTHPRKPQGKRQQMEDSWIPTEDMCLSFPTCAPAQQLSPLSAFVPSSEISAFARELRLHHIPNLNRMLHPHEQPQEPPKSPSQGFKPGTDTGRSAPASSTPNPPSVGTAPKSR